MFNRFVLRPAWHACAAVSLSPSFCSSWVGRSAARVAGFLYRRLPSLPCGCIPLASMVCARCSPEFDGCEDEDVF